MDDDVEVPKYFICPISLQIMKDPVTAITGITYDRDNIEQWLLVGKKTSCPVTQQPLPRDSDLTPNHTLRRLIQAWCTENASLGVDRIPTPKPSIDKSHFLKLIKDLQHPDSKMKTLRELDLLAAKNERNRNYMVQAGVPKAMLSFIVNCFKEVCVNGLEEALSVLFLIRIPPAEAKLLPKENDQIIKSLIWVLGCEFKTNVMVKSHAVLVLKTIVETSSIVLERLEPQFFETIVGILKPGTRVTQQGMNSALHVLLDTCPWGRNRLMMVESGAISALIELELGSPGKRTTELIMGILFHLCSCANGRAEFLSHKGGVAVVTKRILRVSPTVDDRAVQILSLINKFSATNLVVQEMLDVGTVTKLCMLLQVDCATYLKEKAMEILKSHSDEWQKFPCTNKTLLTRYIN
ncbi:E3 ubiquitin-protein ligase PUB24-like [Durio zibethinus]|uniref:U-box domain-containing protein n=1 Tax=Durio zibethinus TaxID=66656 RepID=A0A6P6AMF2_DURZI|nr:E3 ubiquitin-protein ligase PUB24-like [Durio zibethinus]